MGFSRSLSSRPISRLSLLSDLLWVGLAQLECSSLTTALVTTRFCKDLVSYDVPDRNPFRGLVPLTMKNPLLQHIIVAASAAHMSNLMRPSLPRLQHGNSQVVRFASTEASSRALRDALIAKQEALKLMHNAVQNIDSVGVDVVLAASLFFINVELIESGKHGWQAHLEGAGKIMSYDSRPIKVLRHL